eukprot:SAG11_NODE_28221_length_324_cov_0.724444_2_plen_23_part_01
MGATTEVSRAPAGATPTTNADPG